MEASTSSVINKMTTIDDNPLEYDDLVVAWNTLCAQSWAENTGDFQFADIENAAIAALSDDPAKKRSGHIGNDISRMLSTVDYPAYLVTADGHIAAVNSAASLEFELCTGDKIDQLPYSLDASQDISALISDNLRSPDAVPVDALLKRAHSKDNEREATIAITTSLGRVPSALVFIITTKWKTVSAELLKCQFGLTDTETELLVSFVDGYSSQDIARLRRRSHSTVRTQLQSVLTKTGARNQTELLRIALSVSDFSRNIGVIADAVNHPHRRRAELLREGGRVIEVTLMGDPSGDPVLSIANTSIYTFNADFEQGLFESGIYIISVCTPGCGKSDPSPKQISRLDCLTSDIEAVLNQLNVATCPILALTSSPPLCIYIAKNLSTRISHVVQVNACAPAKYSTPYNTQSPWVTAILRTGKEHPSMKRILLKGAIKAWATIGAKQFMRLQLSSNHTDAKYALRPENIKEYEHALKTATQGGVFSAAEDTLYAFSDWTDDIKYLEAKMTIVHGTNDKLFVIDAIRALVSDLPTRINLIEIDDAGYTLWLSHPGRVINLLRSVVDNLNSTSQNRLHDTVTESKSESSTSPA